MKVTLRAIELRIGNYVYGINRRSEIHIPDELPLKVLQIELFNTEVLPLDQNPATVEKWFKITNEDLFPIPLTEEWLLKFGFVKKYADVEIIYEKNPFRICSNHNYSIEYSESHDDYYTKITNGKYVHSLQNLYFALTNEELTTK